MKKLPLSRRGFVKGSAAAGAAAAVGGVTAPYAYAEGDTLRVRNYSDIQALDPAYTLSAVDSDVQRVLFPSLIEFKTDDTWDWQLSSASSVEQVDDTHINFTLLPGMGWTNGFGGVTADDVKFSFERIADPEMQSPYAEDWSALDHVEVTGELTGTIVLKEPYAPLWTTTLPSVSGQIVSRKAVEGLESKRFEAVPPCVSGPYEIKEWLPSQKLVLTRIDGWAGGATPEFG
ncbi:MAG: ABC transporter substrate-binding protein, partial [Proteobacteria bacterium]|nr:ABC transporter substrate-binding protein [Pseudomonadota bacterium]